jgi:TP901 family phage tail tape measure protein
MGLEEVGAKLILEGESQFTAGMKRAEDQSTGFGRTLSKVADGIAQGFGQQLFKAVSKGVGMIPDLLGDALKSTMDWGKGLDDIGDILGTTTKQSAGLQAMFKTIGGSSEQLTGAMAKMSAGLKDAKGQLGPTGTALKSLGIKFEDAKGKMLPATTIFQMVADKIGNMPDGLEKTSLMMDIFGKSGKEMGDALAAAANGGMDLYIKKAEEMGLAIDPEQIVRNNIAIETLKLAWTGLGNRIMEKVLPIIEDFTWKVVHMLDDPNIKKNIDLFYNNLLTAWKWVETNIFPIAQSLYNWVTIEIPKGIDTLKKAWDKDFSPSIQAAWNWVSNNSTKVWQPVFDWVNTKIPSAIEVGKTAWNTYQTTMGGLVDYINGPVKTAFDDTAVQLNEQLPGATLFFQNKLLDLKWKWQDFVAYSNDYIVPIFTTIKDIIGILIDKAVTPLKDLVSGAFSTAWSGLATILKIDVSGAFTGLQFDILTPLVEFFNGPMRSALIDLLARLSSLKNMILNMPSLPSISIPGITGSSWKPGSTPYPGETEMANGGSFIIPKEYGFEGFNLGGMATASAGERVTVTPAAVSAGPSNYQYSYATNYNLNLTTQQTEQNVQQSFAIMRMLAG